MTLTPRLDLRPAQSLTMTQRLRQAIDLLQMSALELESAVDAELEKNPFLERESDGDSAVSEPLEDSDFIGREEMPSLLDGGDEAPLDTNDEPTEDSFYEQAADDAASASFDFMDVWSGAGAKGARDDDFDAMDLCPARGVSLEKHLSDRILANFDDKAERKTAFAMLEKLDDGGYLTAPLSAEEERLLPRLQAIAPTGVFARDLAECLRLQLKERDRCDPAMENMLNHLDLAALREYKKLSKLCGVDEEDVADMVAEIQRLNPKPAADFVQTPVAAVVPDVLLRRGKAGEFTVELNQAVLPRVLINRTYAAEIATLAGRDKHAKKFMNEQLSGAGFLIKALNQRAETILKVAVEIVERQRDFFVHGTVGLKPMVLKDVAEAVELHESTVSRVTQQKYIATPVGTFELKYFFSQGVGAGGDVSGQAVKSKIKTLIDAEKPDNILSDEALVVLLKRDGVDIARRTVAKYRESLGIPTSARRKRDKRLILKRK